MDQLKINWTLSDQFGADSLTKLTIILPNHGQVLALTPRTEIGFERNLKTGLVIVDLSSAYHERILEKDVYIYHKYMLSLCLNDQNTEVAIFHIKHKMAARELSVCLGGNKIRFLKKYPFITAALIGPRIRF